MSESARDPLTDQMAATTLRRDDAVAAGAQLLRALGHPARLRIVLELTDHDRCVHELVDLVGLPQPTVSQHLSVLRAARLVRGVRVHREMRYSLVDHHVGHIALDAVGHATETEPPEIPRQEHLP